MQHWEEEGGSVYNFKRLKIWLSLKCMWFKRVNKKLMKWSKLPYWHLAYWLLSKRSIVHNTQENSSFTVAARWIIPLLITTYYIHGIFYYYLSSWLLWRIIHRMQLLIKSVTTWSCDHIWLMYVNLSPYEQWINNLLNKPQCNSVLGMCACHKCAPVLKQLVLQLWQCAWKILHHMTSTIFFERVILFKIKNWFSVESYTQESKSNPDKQ